jgi:alpha-L-fucosidase 2
MVVWAAMSCGGDSPVAPPGPATQLTVDRDSLAFDAIADQTLLTVTVRDARGNPSADPVTWRSADASVASVDSVGRVRSVGPGRTTIRASAGAAVDSVLVRVTQVARSVALGADTLRFATIGRVGSTTATVRDRNAVALTGTVQRWTIADPSVASVAPDGMVTARAAGTTYLVVEVDALRDSAVIVVRPVAARLALSVSGLVVDVGATNAMSATATDSGGTVLLAGDVARFVSRDPSVATIDIATGLLRGVAAGTTTVIANGADNAALTDSAVVVVAAPGWIIGRVSLVGADPTGVTPGSTLTLRVTIDAARLAQAGALGAAEATLRWDPSVLALDSLRSAPDAAAHQATPGVVAIAYAAADAVVGGVIELATLHVRVLSPLTAGREALLILSTPYLPVGLDFVPVTQWAGLSDRVRIR